MVAGVTGIDCYLMVIAATEGVMPQTIEHARILDALGIGAGIVAITMTDLADGDAAADAARALLPGAAVIILPPRLPERRAAVLGALEELARGIAGRAGRPGPALMHIDRCFTIAGAGTVVTGTLGAGEVARGDILVVHPQGFRARVRGVEVHGEAVARAVAGERVAVNLARVTRASLARGDVLAAEGAVSPAYSIEVEVGVPLPGALRVAYVHHGTRATLARVRPRGNSIELRCQAPLMARPGDRIVLRDASCRETLGGAIVLAGRARGRAQTRAARDEGHAQPVSRQGVAPPALGQGARAAPAARPGTRSPGTRTPGTRTPGPAPPGPAPPGPAPPGPAPPSVLAAVEAEIRTLIARGGLCHAAGAARSSRRLTPRGEGVPGLLRRDRAHPPARR